MRVGRIESATVGPVKLLKEAVTRMFPEFPAKSPDRVAESTQARNKKSPKNRDIVALLAQRDIHS